MHDPSTYVLAVIAVPAIVAHFLCVFTLAQPAMRKRKYCYHIVLAVADYLQLVFLIFAAFREKEIKKEGEESEKLGEESKKQEEKSEDNPLRITEEFFSQVGVYAIFLLALDTYIAVVHPLHFPSTQTNKMYIVRCLGVLPLALFSFSYTFPNLIYLSVTLSYLVPLLAIPCLYLATAKRFRELNLNSGWESSPRHKENIKLLLLMILVLYTEHLPSCVMMIICKPDSPHRQSIHLANDFLHYLGNVVTIFLYYVCKSEFRSTFLGMTRMSCPAFSAPADAADVAQPTRSVQGASEGQLSIPQEEQVRDAVEGDSLPVQVSSDT